MNAIKKRTDTLKQRDVSHLKHTTRHTTIIVHDVHARESRKGGKMGTQTSVSQKHFHFMKAEHIESRRRHKLLDEIKQQAPPLKRSPVPSTRKKLLYPWRFLRQQRSGSPRKD